MTIEDLFDKQAGKWQGPTGVDGLPTERKSLLVRFNMSSDPVSLLIHASANYVGVYSKEGDGGEWEVLGYHDSCWREAVESFIRKYAHELQFSFLPFRLPDMNDFTHDMITSAIQVVHISLEFQEMLCDLRKKRYQ